MIEWIKNTALGLLSFFIAAWTVGTAISHAGYAIETVNSGALTVAVSVMIGIIYLCMKRIGGWLLLMVGLGASL